MTTVGYDPLARVIQRQHSNGVLTTQTWDPAGNVSGITNNGPSSLISSLTYAYNPADQRTRQAENDGTVTTWTYDRAYQIINEDRAGGPAGTSFNVTHTYDPAGNQTLRNERHHAHHLYLLPRQQADAGAGGVRGDHLHQRCRRQSHGGSAQHRGLDVARLGRPRPDDLGRCDGGRHDPHLQHRRPARRQAEHRRLGHRFLYDHKRLLQETDEVGGDVTKMYASSTTDEFGDLIGEDGEYIHVYDAQANTRPCLKTRRSCGGPEMPEMRGVATKRLSRKSR